MIYSEDDWFEISALNRFLFCRRRFALSVIECQWGENVHTIAGDLMHERAHDSNLIESRKDKIITHAMRVFSPDLGVSGECDVVEFIRDSNGVSIHGRDGLWRICPVEYKQGTAGRHVDNDMAQLCCQAMCLEFMFCVVIDHGFIYYAGSHKRDRVDFTEELRNLVKSSLAEMHDLYVRKYTPVVKPKKYCRSCSLYDACMPALSKQISVRDYMKQCGEL